MHAPEHLTQALDILLTLIKNSDPIRRNQREPDIEHEQAAWMLSIVKKQTNICLRGYAKNGQSIYCLFVNLANKTCFLCGTKLGSFTRAVDHVRGDLNHRPFLCSGRAGGCTSRHCVIR